MNREQMVEKALDALRWEHVGGSHFQVRFGETDAELRRAAADVVDALLPQVSTVEELEALPRATKLIVDRNGVPAMRVNFGPGFLAGFSGNVEWDAATLLEYADGPLTVVWRPES